jgi:hypothetical protein
MIIVRTSREISDRSRLRLTPEGGDVIDWRDHEISKRNLGHAEAARQLEHWLQRCHPNHKASVNTRLIVARAGEGPTVRSL